jgi:hypothetical protein
MALFSQRKGFKPVRETVQIESMDESLRDAIWNSFHNQIVQRQGFLDRGSTYTYTAGQIHDFANLFWAHFLKKAVETRPQTDEGIYKEPRDVFFRFHWYEVYDFVEFIIACIPQTENYERSVNAALETEMAAYGLAQGKIIEITSKTELNAVDDALNQSDFPGASQHLKRALELVSDKLKPVARNSIKESISAVESAAQVLTGNPKATLGDALKIADKKKQLHPALKEAFLKLYGYTNDHGGIRHAMLDESNLTKGDALFFLVTCSAFINYLKSKI